MLQLKNATPFAADIAVFANENGVDTLYSIVKASFSLDGALTLAEEQLPPQKEDEYWGDPENSSIKLASDFHVGKAATDIVVLGSAIAPAGQLVRYLDVEVCVDQVSKQVRVFGDRNWENGAISPAQGFTEMPITYEKAFGGRHDLNETQYLVEEKNFIGQGFAGKRSRRQMDGRSLPNIEDPNDLIQYYNDTPVPVGFGFCSPAWLPRRQFAGTYDDEWQKRQAPFLPKDFNKRFFNSAHPNLIAPHFLVGGEAFSITNMHSDGPLSGFLPQLSLICDVNLGGQSHKQTMILETLIFEPNKKQLAMVWRSELACDKQVLKINDIQIKLLR